MWRKITATEKYQISTTSRSDHRAEIKLTDMNSKFVVLSINHARVYRTKWAPAQNGN